MQPPPPRCFFLLGYFPACFFNVVVSFGCSQPVALSIASQILPTIADLLPTALKTQSATVFKVDEIHWSTEPFLHTDAGAAARFNWNRLLVYSICEAQQKQHMHPFNEWQTQGSGDVCAHIPGLLVSQCLSFIQISLSYTSHLSTAMFACLFLQQLPLFWKCIFRRVKNLFFSGIAFLCESCRAND